MDNERHWDGSRRVAQLLVPCKDLESAEAFYGGLLGLGKEFAAPNVVAMDAGGMRLLLAHSPSADGKTGGIVPYVAVDDIAETHTSLVKAGAVDGGAPHKVADLEKREIWIAFVDDPTGNRIGLIEERQLP